MNSAKWREYPKGADFPRVGECPDCHGTGLRINKMWVPTNRQTWQQRRPESTFYVECGRCEGRGKVVPAEWIAE